jgi:hypothetical protein
VGASVVGQLYSVQYKSIFGASDKVRCNMCEEAVVPGNKSGIVLLVLEGKGTPGMFDPVI